MIVHQSGVTIKEAAQLLGISEAAVRQRLLRGTLTSTRQNGRVFVLLPEDTSGDTVDDTIPTPDDTPDDTIAKPSDTVAHPINLPLDMQLRDEIIFLRGQVDIKDRQISELHVMVQTAQRQLPATVLDPSHPSAQSGDRETPIEQEQTSQRGVQREPEVSWRARLRRWMGWG